MSTLYDLACLIDGSTQPTSYIRPMSGRLRQFIVDDLNDCGDTAKIGVALAVTRSYVDGWEGTFRTILFEVPAEERDLARVIARQVTRGLLEVALTGTLHGARASFRGLRDLCQPLTGAEPDLADRTIRMAEDVNVYIPAEHDPEQRPIIRVCFGDVTISTETMGDGCGHEREVATLRVSVSVSIDEEAAAVLRVQELS